HRWHPNRNRGTCRKRSCLMDRLCERRSNTELTMMLSRRIFNGAIVAAALVTAVQLASAGASTAVPFSADAFKAAQTSGSPILVEIHADWCPTCKAQGPILDKLTADPKFRDLKVFRVDFDAIDRKSVV